VHGLPECLLYEYVIEQKNKEVRVMHWYCWLIIVLRLARKSFTHVRTATDCNLVVVLSLSIREVVNSNPARTGHFKLITFKNG
jgi:hypothetical protein